MNARHYRQIGNLIGSLALVLPFAMGCGDAQVHSSASVIDKTTHALSLGSFLEVNGQYGAGCTNRSGSWSVSMGGFGQLSNAPLTVIKNDTGCTLDLSSLRLGSMMTNGLFVPPAAVSLGTSYLGSAVSFATTSGGTTAFFGNVRVQPDLSFNSDFSINVLYSDDPKLASASAIASYAVQSATASSGSVAPPDYALDMTGISIQVDQAKIEQSVSGSGALTFMNTGGQHFVVSSSDLGTSPAYADVDAAYQAGTPQSLSGMNPNIAASAFGLSMIDLSSDQIRTLIVANTANATSSYEVFRITFAAP